MDKVNKDDFLFFVKDVIKNNPNWLSDLQLAIMGGISNRLQEEINYRANAEKSLSVCYDSIHELQEINKVIALDDSKIGRFGFNKCTTLNNDKEEIWLTVYDTNNRHDKFDEQLTFRPKELIEFCREVIRISEQS